MTQPANSDTQSDASEFEQNAKIGFAVAVLMADEVCDRLELMGVQVDRGDLRQQAIARFASIGSTQFDRVLAKFEL
jgi:S1-C subfamily serine protease